MHAGVPIAVDAPMQERVTLWREDYRHFEENPEALISQLRFLKPLVGNEEFNHWQELAARHEVVELFERLMSAHYDPLYKRSLARNYGAGPMAMELKLERLDRAYLDRIAASLA
jgi:tRNA 2-selenouridine synthase